MGKSLQVSIDAPKLSLELVTRVMVVQWRVFTTAPQTEFLVRLLLA